MRQFLLPFQDNNNLIDSPLWEMSNGTCCPGVWHMWMKNQQYLAIVPWAQSINHCELITYSQSADWIW